MNVLNTILSKVMPWVVKPEQATAAQAAPAAPATTSSGAAPAQHVDVEEILRGIETRSSQKFDWRHSIVDLMKMLDMDSDLTSRRQLAKELGYSGDTADSATMNLWLHKEVMRKLEENGGKIPDAMKH